MIDLTGYKFYTNDIVDAFNPKAEFDNMEDAVYWIWANRRNYNKIFLLLKAEEDSPNIIEEEINVARLEYDESYNIYYWFNISSENISGFPVNSPEDILEMLKINPIVGEEPEEDDTEYSGIQDKDMVVLDVAHDVAVDINNEITPFYPLGNDKF